MDLITEYSVCWLDDQQSDPLTIYQISRSKLRGIIDYLVHFTTPSACAEDIRRKIDKAIFVIVTSSCCSPLLDQIHALPQVHSAYVYQGKGGNKPISDVLHSDTSTSYKKVGYIQYSLAVPKSCWNKIIGV